MADNLIIHLMTSQKADDDLAECNYKKHDWLDILIWLILPKKNCADTLLKLIGDKNGTLKESRLSPYGNRLANFIISWGGQFLINVILELNRNCCLGHKYALGLLLLLSLQLKFIGVSDPRHNTRERTKNKVQSLNPPPKKLKWQKCFNPKKKKIFFH